MINSQVAEQFSVELPDTQGIRHEVTFASLWSAFQRMNSARYDEAIRNSPMNALAMRRDAYIKSLLNERKLPVAQCEWDIEVPDPKNPEQLDLKKKLVACVKAIPRFTVLRMYLLEAVWYGRYGAQVRWNKNISSQGYYTVSHHLPVNGDKIQFDWEGNAGVMVNPMFSFGKGDDVRFTDRAPVLMLSPERRRNFVIHRHEVDDADYFEWEMAGAVNGVGVRSQIYWSWFLRDQMLNWVLTLMEKVGTLGILIFWYEQGNAEAKKKAEEAAERSKNDTAIIAPRPVSGNGREAFGVQHIPINMTGIDAIRGMVNEYFDSHIERLIVGQTLSSNSEGNGLGGTGVAKFHQNTKTQILLFDAKNLDDTFNEDLIPNILAVNGWKPDFPVVYKSLIPDPESEQKLGAVEKASRIGVSFGESAIRQLTGIPEPDEGEKIVGGNQQQQGGMGGPGQIPPGAGGQGPDGMPVGPNGSPTGEGDPAQGDEESAFPHNPKPVTGAKSDPRLEQHQAIMDAMLHAAVRAKGGDEEAENELSILSDLAANPEQLDDTLGVQNYEWLAHGVSRSGKSRWKNSDTGRVVYQDKKPGERKEKRDKAGEVAQGHIERWHMYRNGEGQNLTAEHWQELAEHIPAMSMDQLKNARNQLMLGVKNKPKHAEMVRAIQDHVRGIAAGEIDHERPEPKPAKERAPRTAQGGYAKRSDGTPEQPNKRDVYTVKPDTLKVDPSRFQYKVVGIGAQGVTQELKGTDKWNPELGGVLLAWRDPETGQDYVVNGHHRHELAMRTGAENVNVRYIDAPSDKEARARGALANIAEGRGTATDAAKYLRDSGQDIEHLKKAGISLSGKIAADSQHLSQLSGSAFLALTKGELPEDKAVVIGKHLPGDAIKQDMLIKKLNKMDDDGREWSKRELETAAKKIANAGSVESTEMDLFGGTDEVSTFDQEVELEAHVQHELSKMASDYGALSSTGRADRVKDAGNTLATDENSKRRDKYRQHLDTFGREANLRGPVSATIKEMAAQLAQAKTKKEREAIKSETQRRIGELLERGPESLAADARGGSESGARAQGALPDATGRPLESPGSTEPESAPGAVATQPEATEAQEPTSLFNEPAQAEQPQAPEQQAETPSGEVAPYTGKALERAQKRAARANARVEKIMAKKQAKEEAKAQAKAAALAAKAEQDKLREEAKISTRAKRDIIKEGVKAGMPVGGDSTGQAVQSDEVKPFEGQELEAANQRKADANAQVESILKAQGANAGQFNESHYNQVAKRFGIPAEAVKSIAETHYDELRDRDRYNAPVSTDEPTTDYPQHPLGTGKASFFMADKNEGYVSYLGKMHPKSMVPIEHEDGVTKTPGFQKYLDWAREGIEPPPVSVAETPSGQMNALNRRRVLAAQMAGTPELKAWISAHNKETGNPLKYGDVMKALGEAKESAASPADAQGESKAVQEPRVGEVMEFPATANGRLAFSLEVERLDDKYAYLKYPGGDYTALKIPRESLSQYRDDLMQRVNVPATSEIPEINDVINGKGNLLGHGDDGMAFEVGGKIVKVSSVVPFHPTNSIGQRTPEQAIEQANRQFETAKEMFHAGVPGIMRQSLRQIGDKLFTVRDKLEIPEKLTAEQLDQVRHSLDAMHAAGYSLNDNIQVGIGSDGKVYHYDTGKAAKISHPDDVIDDSVRFETFSERNGHDPLPLREKAKRNLENVSKQEEFYARHPKGMPKSVREFNERMRAGLSASDRVASGDNPAANAVLSQPEPATTKDAPTTPTDSAAVVGEQPAAAPQGQKQPHEMTKEEWRQPVSHPEVAQPTPMRTVKMTSLGFSGEKNYKGKVYALPGYKGPELAVSEQKIKGFSYPQFNIHLAKSGQVIYSSSGVNSLNDSLKEGVQKVATIVKNTGVDPHDLDHYMMVQNALLQKKPVPEHVIGQYPKLLEKYGEANKERLASQSSAKIEPAKAPGDSGNWAPENHVKIAADSIEKLREQDVYRLLDSAPAQHRQAMADYISQNRPEFSEEIRSSMDDLGATTPAATAPKEAPKPTGWEGLMPATKPEPEPSTAQVTQNDPEPTASDAPAPTNEPAPEPAEIADNETLAEMRAKHQQSVKDMDARHESEINSLVQKHKTVRGDSKRAAVEQEWKDAKLRHQDERVKHGQDFMGKLKLHPEYIAEQKALIEKGKQRAAEIEELEKKSQADHDRRQVEAIRAKGGFDAVLSELREDLRQLQITHNRTKESNRSRLPSIELRQKNIDYVEALRKKYPDDPIAPATAQTSEPEPASAPTGWEGLMGSKPDNQATEPQDKTPVNDKAMDRPYTIAEHDEIDERIKSGQISADEVRQHIDRFASSQDALRQEISKKKVDDLKKEIMRQFGYVRPDAKKSDLVEKYLNGMAWTYYHPASGGSGVYTVSGMGKMSMIDDIKANHAHKITDESIKAFADKVQQSRDKMKESLEAKKAEIEGRKKALEKAIENPQTLEDYRMIANAKGEESLTKEQLAAYDDLRASSRREKDKESKKASAVVEGFEPGESATGNIGIVEGHHQKRNAKTFTVTVENHLGDNWNEALSNAKRLGGSYVNARIAKAFRATPGFQFFDKAKAEEFARNLRGESVDRSNDVEAMEKARLEGRAGTLEERGQALINDGQDKLTQGRRENTQRQSEHAAYARAAAHAQIAKGQTLQAIGRGQSEGKIKHLNSVRSAQDLATLDHVLKMGQYQRIDELRKQNADGLSQIKFDELRSSPLSVDDVDHVKFPYPRANEWEIQDLATAMREVPGVKRFAEELAKHANPHKDVKFQSSAGGMVTRGGKILRDVDIDPSIRSKIKELLYDSNGESGSIRLHASYDDRLKNAAKEKGIKDAFIFYTADKGKSWGIDEGSAIAAAYNSNHELDLLPASKPGPITFTDKEQIDNIRKASRKLIASGNERLRRVGQSLKAKLEHYDRLQRADILNEHELRAALREYVPLMASAGKEDPIKKMERDLKGTNIPGFFPTPKPVVDQMLDIANIEPGHTVLEPSAGKGDILDAIVERSPEAKTHAIEIDSRLRSILEAKGHNVVDNDFTGHNGQYDRIVMNPPFERGQDIEHVRKAFELLKPGGRLVAVMSESPFFNSNSKATEFRDWLDSNGGVHERLPEGSFAGDDAFRKTGVNTRIVTIDKPGTSDPQAYQYREEISNAWAQMFGATS